MLSVDEDQEVDVRGSLARRSRSLRATGRRSWDAKSLIDGVGDIHVPLDERVVTADGARWPIRWHNWPVMPRGTWNCLRANREFSGGVKIVLLPETGRLGAAAEIPMSEDNPTWEVHLDYCGLPRNHTSVSNGDQGPTCWMGAKRRSQGLTWRLCARLPDGRAANGPTGPWPFRSKHRRAFWEAVGVWLWLEMTQHMG